MNIIAIGNKKHNENEGLTPRCGGSANVGSNSFAKSKLTHKFAIEKAMLTLVSLFRSGAKALNRIVFKNLNPQIERDSAVSY